MYWSLRAHKLEGEKNFKETAECYRKSAEILSKLDEKSSYDEYISSYKWLAIANKYNKEIFEENINKAIEFADKRKDENQKFYFLGLKYDHFVRFTDDVDEKIKYLEQALGWYHKGGKRIEAKTPEFMLSYVKFQKALGDKNYENAKNYLNQAMDRANDARFPNIIPSPDTLKKEKYLCDSYLHISQGRFSDAEQSLSEWIDRNKELENTTTYQFYRILRESITLINKTTIYEKRFDTRDLYKLADLHSYIRANKLGGNLLDICSLTYSYLCLWMHNLTDNLDAIKIEIIRKVGGEEIAENLKHRLKVQKAIEQREWLLSLQPIFAEKFDSCIYFLENVLDEYRHTAIREFYLLVESFLKIVIEFNAKILLREKWKLKLEEDIANNKKPFEVFTFGDLVQSLKLLKDNGSEFCKDITSETFEVLNKHVEIRNKLSHEFVKEPPKFDVVESTSRIMYNLLHASPTCVKVISARKKPWYDIEILWNQLPRRVSLYSNGELIEGYYYIERVLEAVDNKLYPKVIIDAQYYKTQEQEKNGFKTKI